MNSRQTKPIDKTAYENTGDVCPQRSSRLYNKLNTFLKRITDSFLHAARRPAHDAWRMAHGACRFVFASRFAPRALRQSLKFAAAALIMATAIYLAPTLDRYAPNMNNSTIQHLIPAAHSLMIADTLVIYAFIDGVDGLTANEGVVIYNPTDDSITLTGYALRGFDDPTIHAFTSADSIPAFGYFFIADPNSGSALGKMRDRVVSAGAFANTTSDSIALVLTRSATDTIIVDAWDLGAGGGEGGIVGGGAADGVNDYYRRPALQLMWGIKPDSLQTSMIFGGGGMIDNDDNPNDVINDTHTDTIVYKFTVNAKPDSAIKDRLVFECTAPVSASAGVNFGLSCTIVMEWKGVVYRDSIASAYSGNNAWANITVDAGSISGLSADSRFNDKATGDTWGVLNNYQINLSTAGIRRVTISDAACTGYVDVSISSAGDTISYVHPATSGTTHDTSNANITVAGNCANSIDTVAIYIDGSFRDSDGVVVGDSGKWDVSGVEIKDTGFPGETVVVFGYDNGVEDYQDTLYLIYDATNPRIASIDDADRLNGQTVARTNVTINLTILDTGVNLDGAGTVTMHYNGSITGTVAMSEAAGTAATTRDFSGVLPLGSAAAGAAVHYWFSASDDAGNNTLLSGLSPGYLASDSATVTMQTEVSVRQVVISEIMFDGDDGEYVELFNTTSDSINLAGYIFEDGHGDGNGGAGAGFRLQLTQHDTIPPNGFFLIYQSAQDDSSLPMTDTSKFNTTDGRGSAAGVPDWDNGNDLAIGGDSVELWRIDPGTGDSVSIDSAPYLAAWPVTLTLTPDPDTLSVSMERKLTFSGGSWSAGYGGTSSEWAAHNGIHGKNGRPNGTPGAINSSNMPNMTISPRWYTQTGGRGQWTLTLNNGPQTFSNGRVVVQVPSGWSAPNNSNTAGDVFVSISNGSINTTTYSGDSIIIDLNSWTATSGQITITYGNNSDTRAGIALASTTADTYKFLFFFDTDGTNILGDEKGLYSAAGNTVVLVKPASGLQLTDTDPSSNPQSFISANYPISIYAKYGSHYVYGAHIWAVLQGNGTDSTVAEYGSFNGFYEPNGNSVTRVGGYPNAEAALYQFDLNVAAEVAPATNGNLNQIRFYDTDVGVNISVYSDSSRTPVPVINELEWADGGALEFIEIYNPTHAVQDISNWDIEVGGVDEVLFGTPVSIPPHGYFLVTDASPVADDQGGSVQIVVDAASYNAAGEIVIIQDAGNAEVDKHLPNGVDWQGGVNAAGADSSMVRLYPNRAGSISSSWGTSDSQMARAGGAIGYGSPGRPNSPSLKLGTVMDRLDTVVTDTAQVILELRLASRDTQPNQQIGFLTDWGSTGVIDAPSTSGLSGTVVFKVGTGGANHSGTMHVTLGTPYMFAGDSVDIVIDNEGLKFNFRASDTNIAGTSAANALVVEVGIGDTTSGVDTTIMPKFMWKYSETGTYSAESQMTQKNTSETFVAYIDVGGKVYSSHNGETIYWAVVWRDLAGNWDTGIDTRVAGEYIDRVTKSLEITAPADGHNSTLATITVSGTTAFIPAGDSIVIFVNNIVRDSAAVTYANTWVASSVEISGTGDSISARVYDTNNIGGQLRFTDTITVNYTGSNAKPSCTIQTPADFDTYGNDSGLTCSIILYDGDSNAVSMVIEFSKDSGSTWGRATTDDTGGLRVADPYGETHVFVWRKFTDLSYSDSDHIRMRITPDDGTETGPADTTNNFRIDNKEPTPLIYLTADPDVTAPGTGVILTWTLSASTDSVGYNVYRFRGTDSAPAVKLNSVILDTIQFLDTQAALGDSNFYFVVVRDTFNNESDSYQWTAAPNLQVTKTYDTSAVVGGRIRPGDTYVYIIKILNNGFAPARDIVLYDYIPSTVIRFDTTTVLDTTKPSGFWNIYYRYSESPWSWGVANEFIETATMIRFEAKKTLHPETGTASDTLKFEVRVK